MGYKVGDKIQINDYRRVRTIYINAEVSPGTIHNHRGYTGEVAGIFDDTGELSYEVKRPAGRWGSSWEEHTESEIAGMAD